MAGEPVELRLVTSICRSDHLLILHARHHSEAYDRSQVPMTASLGYQPCYINPINHTQADIQISVEYLVRALQLLRAESSRKVPTIGGSQGNLIAQWAYAFYPSARQNALSHFSMAGDFKGTKLAPIAITTGLGTATPAVWQQNYGSHLVTALANAGGLNAQIPTTSVYSATDEILQPEGPTPETATSYLYGATNVRLQDVCGPAFVMGHVQHFTNSFVFKILQAHLASPTRMAQPASIRATDCSLLLAWPPLTADDKLHFQDANVFSQINANQPGTYKPRCEPLLRDYARSFDKTAPTTGC